MPKTLKNKYYEKLTYEKLMEAHIKSRKGKGNRKEIIMFNLKQEEYIMWLLEKLEKEMNINIYGKIENNGEIQIMEIYA